MLATETQESSKNFILNLMIIEAVPSLEKDKKIILEVGLRDV